jgi:hypothetical protein
VKLVCETYSFSDFTILSFIYTVSESSTVPNVAQLPLEVGDSLWCIILPFMTREFEFYYQKPVRKSSEALSAAAAPSNAGAPVTAPKPRRVSVAASGQGEQDVNSFFQNLLGQKK